MALNVPATVEATHRHHTGRALRDRQGCSGKRYLLVALAFAVLTVRVGGIACKRAVLMVAARCGGAIVNWVRVIVIIYAGHLTNMEHYLVAQDHITFGW